MNSLINEIYNISQVKEIIENYKNLSPIFLHGLTDESKSHIYETIFHYTKKCLVIVCENEKKAKLMCDDINSFVEDTCMYFPSTEINYYNIKNLEKKKMK